jgi:hypothetical protein
VYTICPGCGKEHSMGLDDLHELDLDCTVYCEDCTASRELLRKAAAQHEEGEAAFYVKGAVDTPETRIPFTGSICTECANCGKEISVDLSASL